MESEILCEDCGRSYDYRLPEHQCKPIDKAMKRLNRYDYESGKSAQEALALLHDLKEIFTT